MVVLCGRSQKNKKKEGVQAKDNKVLGFRSSYNY
jgi:hypothetical protein